MAIVYQAQDADEMWHDTDAEQMGNIHLYGVISGCAVTYDAADMTWDIAAGTILHNGSVVTVAAQTNVTTLVADSTNPRWTLLYVNSSGTGGIVSGTAAATPSTLSKLIMKSAMMMVLTAAARFECASIFSSSPPESNMLAPIHSNAIPPASFR